MILASIFVAVLLGVLMCFWLESLGETGEIPLPLPSFIEKKNLLFGFFSHNTGAQPLVV